MRAKRRNRAAFYNHLATALMMGLLMCHTIMKCCVKGTTIMFVQLIYQIKRRSTLPDRGFCCLEGILSVQHLQLGEGSGGMQKSSKQKTQLHAGKKESTRKRKRFLDYLGGKVEKHINILKSGPK
jgi:hypothetical protein